MFRHFIITRFNIKSREWQKDKNDQWLLSEEWMQARFKLFLNYCFPSIKNQINQDFKWLVYFDVDTSNQYRKIIDRLQKEYNSYIPLFVPDYSTFINRLSDDIRKHIPSSCEYIITTRLDNDDCFEKNAVGTIQGHFKKQELAVIDLQKGYCLQIEPFFGISYFNFPLNQFISLIERIIQGEKIQTVYSRQHNTWAGVAPVISVSKGGHWMQVIHKSNMANKLTGRLTLSKKILKNFGIKINGVYGCADYIRFIKWNTKYYLRKILPAWILARLAKFKRRFY